MNSESLIVAKGEAAISGTRPKVLDLTALNLNTSSRTPQRGHFTVKLVKDFASPL